MAIHTFEDLARATPTEIEAAKREMLLKDDLDQYFVLMNSQEGWRQTFTFETGHKDRTGKQGAVYPSSACKKGTCPLVLWFDRTGAPSTPIDDARVCRLFDLGTAIHSYLQGCLASMYRDQFDAEVGLATGGQDLGIRGYADGVLRFPGVSFVLELKSIKDGGEFGWDRVQARPLEDNLRQAHLYMRCLGIPLANVLYYRKNTSDLKEHPIVWDASVWRDIEHTIRSTLDPTPPAPKTGYHCRTCRYLQACDAGKDYQHHAKNSARDNQHGRSSGRARVLADRWAKGLPII